MHTATPGTAQPESARNILSLGMLASCVFLLFFFSVPAIAASSPSRVLTQRSLGPHTAVPSWANGRRIHFLPRKAKTEKTPSGSQEGGGAFTGSPPLRYHGGPVQHEPHVYAIFWGSGWNSESAAPTRTLISEMYEAISGSAYQGVLTQYFDHTGRISHTIKFTSYTDTTNVVSPELNDGDFRTEVKAIVEEHALAHGVNDQFVVLPGPGSTYEPGFNSFCAYHSWYGALETTYTWVPIFTSNIGCSYTSSGSLFPLSHEYGESATDPMLNSWYGTGGESEIADLCGAGKLGSFQVSKQWDDFQNACSDSDPTPPHLMAFTEAATSVKPRSAALHASFYTQQQNAEYRFEYGPTTGYGSMVPEKAIALKAGASLDSKEEASQSLGGLSEATVYHYRVSMTNSEGTFYGADQEFKTPVGATTEGAVPINGTSATLRGKLNPYGSETSYYFQYVEASKYHSEAENPYAEGAVIPPSPQKVGAGESEIDVGQAISGLKQRTTYHYRLTSENAEGKFFGMDATLRTADWALQMTEHPGSLEAFAGVSCTSASACTAVGTYDGNSMTQRWNGSNWSIQETPTPSGGTAPVPTGVSCASSSACTAVGSYKNGSAVFVPLAEGWNGSAWAVQTIPSPGGAKESRLESVSCPSASACTAVGYYKNSASTLVTLAERWNGTEWTVQTTPNPSGAKESIEEGVSCPSTSACTAVGNYQNSGGTSVPLAESWNGAEWTVQTIPAPAGALRTVLRDVACSSSTSCTAVGSYGTESILTNLPLAEQWDGIEWLAEGEDKTKPDGIKSIFSAVSCAPAASCTAVGRHTSGGQVIAERYEPPAAPTYQFTFGSKGSGNGQVQRPLGMAVDNAGNVWVADSANNRVEEFNSKGEYVFKFGTFGSGNGQLSTPSDVAITSGGDLWVVDEGNDRVQKFNTEGKYLAQFGSSGTSEGKFEEPAGIAIGPNGHIWVTDFAFYRVSEFSATGEFIRRVGGSGEGSGQFLFPEGIAVDAEGNVWVADRGHHRVQKLSSTGEYISQFGSEGESNGKFKNPTVLDILPSGNLLVADRWTGRVQEFTPQGEFVTKFGGGLFTEPEGIAIGSAGAIYVANSWGNSMQKWLHP
jgi:sugar lactone lactonase YvrE